ncbi:PcfJ domain-containing protein [Pseudoflavonifractor sp. An85]|uniref:PcfJ domain-containing protein n=1 Tax=Pseudoflavonifractor sp. An85 TaxID=1965661 RepID=UPI000B37C8D7|nr:PcfJ domain-containing protein [Pseudoflavonifractor sp. An85]OUN24575.1 hypothetical protein B5G37_07235 [Pseudoflavonifractor sp. An85]
MKDYRKIVSRTPPEWLKEKMAVNLDTGGLIYQIQWVEEDPMGAILERRKRRKTKMVKVKCSECGGEGVLPWAQGRSEKTYGFHHPGEVWNDRWGGQNGDAVYHGDAVLCPWCGSPVEVIRAETLRRNCWHETAETTAMTASTLQGGELVLSGWRAQRRVYRDGHEEVAIDPMEAYVFHGNEACKLTGWRNAYSGNAGYYIELKREWGQPKDWSESWGSEGEIYGLTEELIQGSSMPHCKLVEYMRMQKVKKVYPVAYLRLYQMHPQVENLLMNGLPMLLAELIDQEIGGRVWSNNKKGRLILGEINWDEREPAKMLGLNRGELRLAREMGWCRFLWQLYLAAKESGESLTEEDLRNAFYLGDEDAIDLVGQGPVGKSVAYLLRQIEVCGENEETDPYVEIEDYIGVQMLLDYWHMCRLMGWDLSDKHVKFPPDLCQAHDRVMQEKKDLSEERMKSAFDQRAEVLKKFRFQAEGLLIRPAASQKELNEEAKQLSHCVWSYAERHASGQTAIFFIRHVDKPKKSYFTLELDELHLVVRQNRGKGNCDRTKEVEAFEALWLSWIRAGCKRDKDGEPVLPNRKEMCA